MSSATNPSPSMDSSPLAAASLRAAQRKMYWAAVESDFTAARAVLGVYPDIILGPLNASNDGALHLAVRSGNVAFVQFLLSRMSSDTELLRRDGLGETPLTYAALAGNNNIAKALLRRNPEALLMRNAENEHPIFVAAFHGRGRVVRFLVAEAAAHDFDVSTWSEFFIVAADSKLYDAAYQILDKFGADLRPLLKTVHPEHRTALHVLAKHVLDPGPRSDSRSRLIARIWRAMVSLEEAEIKTLFGQVESPPLVLEAMKAGNTDMVLRVVREFPEMMLCVDANGHGVFHFAMRCWEDTSTLRGTDCLLESLALKQDSEGNNLLHHAAKIPYSLLAPPVNDDMAPCMKLRSEFSRFEAIKNDLPMKCQEMMNTEGLTPMKLFLREHEEMVKLSRNWVKAIAESSLLVAIMVMPLMYGLAEANVKESKKSKKFTLLSFYSVMAVQLVNFFVYRFWYLFYHQFSATDLVTLLPHNLASGLGLYFYSTMLTPVIAFAYLTTFSSKVSTWWIVVQSVIFIATFYISLPVFKLIRDIGRPRQWRP